MRCASPPQLSLCTGEGRGGRGRAALAGCSTTCAMFLDIFTKPHIGDMYSACARARPQHLLPSNRVHRSIHSGNILFSSGWVQVYLDVYFRK